MSIEVTLIDCTWQNPSPSSKIYCKIVSAAPITKTIGQTNSLPIVKSVTWNETFKITGNFTEQLKFLFFSETFFDGSNQICSIDFKVPNAIRDQKKYTIKNDQNQIRLTFSMKRLINSETDSLPTLEHHYPLENYFSFSLQTQKIHKMALIHISNDKSVAQISAPNFSYLSNSVIFKEFGTVTSVLIDLKRTLNIFPFFFIVIQPFYDLTPSGNETDSLSIIFQSGQDLTPLSVLKVNNLTPNSIYSLVYFELHQDSTGISVDIDQCDQVFSNTILNDIFYSKAINAILKSRDFNTEIYQSGSFNTGKIILPEGLTILRIFMLDSSPEKIDLSFTIMKENGSLSDTCFFNSPQILSNSIRLSSDHYHCFDTYSIIDFSKLPPKNQAIIITLTSFYDIPLSKIRSIQIAFGDIEETILSTFPVSVSDDKPGFVLGYLKKIDRHYEFYYLGLPSESKVPNLAAKSAVPILCPIDNDVVWEDA